jgi:hypothetical protein
MLLGLSSQSLKANLLNYHEFQLGIIMSSALNDEIEKDVLPWLRLAEDLRVLKLDVDVS